jgi:hypothetical protein
MPSTATTNRQTAINSRFVGLAEQIPRTEQAKNPRSRVLKILRLAASGPW